MASEDLASLGVEPRFIPLVTSTISQDQQSSDGRPSLDRAVVENLIEILHVVRLYMRSSPYVLNSSAVSLHHPPRRIRF